MKPMTPIVLAGDSFKHQALSTVTALDNSSSKLILSYAHGQIIVQSFQGLNPDGSGKKILDKVDISGNYCNGIIESVSMHFFNLSKFYP
jgi:hypothetical protein